MNNPLSLRSGEASVTVVVKFAAQSLLISFTSSFLIHCCHPLIPPRVNTWLCSPQTSFLLSVLRVHLLFLSWVLRWDEVRGWRLTTPFLLDPNSVSWQLPRGSQFLMVEGHLRRSLGKHKAQCLPQVLPLKTCLSFPLKDSAVIPLLRWHTHWLLPFTPQQEAISWRPYKWSHPLWGCFYF